jgi:carbamoyltransferase
MKILGISPLDKDASASLVEDGRILFAAGEERFSRRKMHEGFPAQAIRAALDATGTKPEEIDAVAYAFFPWDRESELIRASFAKQRAFERSFRPAPLEAQLRRAEGLVPARTAAIPGLREPNQRKRKGLLKETVYRLAGGGFPVLPGFFSRRADRQWQRGAAEGHRRWQQELEKGLKELGLASKLKRFDHHYSHAANSYLASGFDRALIVTLDGYGSGLAGSVSIGEGGRIRRLEDIRYPNSLGTFYETVTSSLGFRADRHAGKIVGLAAYGDPKVLSDVLLSRMRIDGGTFAIRDNLNIWFSRHLAARFPVIDVAAAYQHVLERVAVAVTSHWLRQTGCRHVVLSGGVTANVKMNQRIHEIEGVEGTFVYPNMGDGGCGTGLALAMSWPGGVREPLRDVYLGPSYGEAEIRKELERHGLPFTRPGNLVGEVARRICDGEVIARYAGRMEYGPRALGNRSILYQAKDPAVNQWLNQRLGRTEFMPFAPVTLAEGAGERLADLPRARGCARFMTLAFRALPPLLAEAPGAIHADGTARCQVATRDEHPGLHRILSEYARLTGRRTLVNTSFNRHEEPIVCTPLEAADTFRSGGLDALQLGPFLALAPAAARRDAAAATA